MAAAGAGSPTTTRRRVRLRPSVVLLLGVAIGLGVAAPGAKAQAPHPAKATYDKWCAGCHGVDGAGGGDAAAYMLPRPRDFTQALYQIRTTASGQLPTDEDILDVINEGMPGTAMPGWRDKLSERERLALVDYLKTFSRFFETLPEPEPIEIGGPPQVTPEGLAEGREFYESIECWKCHGQAGRGDGESAPTQEDDAGFPIRPADLTENWLFNGGGTTEDIYRRLRTGLDGTPMPSFSDLIDSGFMTDEQLWHLAQYVRSLSPERAPGITEVMRATLVTGELPTTPGDSAWTASERYYVPLVGQIIVKPRWFAPTVDGVWVEALHNGQELALRLSWHDPSESPDPAWLEWQGRVLATMEPREASAVEPGPRPDALAVQFPRNIPEGMQRPYFLMGDAREPVYLWHWRSEPGAGEAVEALARGLGEIEPLPAADQALNGSAVFDQGRWQLVLRRPLVSDSPDRIAFETGRAIPVAFFAWDGSNAEEGTRGSVSSWYFISLDEPTRATVYTTPALAVVLTAGLGFLVVVRAQRREKEYETS